MYKPLPEYLTIKKSPINGLGLFATKAINLGTVIGITHVKDDRFENGYIRTPLGGFFNHSKNPNCKVQEEKDFLILITIKDIAPLEEVTVFYTLYNPEV